MRRTVLGLSLLLAMSATSGQQARANPWQLTGESVGLSQVGVIHIVPDFTPNVLVGTYTATLTDTASTDLFSGLAINCFMPFIYGSASLYNKVDLSSIFNPTVETWLKALVSHVDVPPATSDASVALELAALELIKEPTATMGDTGGGVMYATGVTPSSIALANQLVANVLTGGIWETPDPQWRVFAWEPVAGQTGQSFLSRERIPEPPMFGLLGVALILLWSLARKRQQMPSFFMCFWGQKSAGPLPAVKIRSIT